MAAPTPDGSAIGIFTGTSGSATLSTTQTNDVIVVEIGYERVNSTATGVSSVTATGLTFTRRGGAMSHQSGLVQALEIWWAPASSVQSGTTIAVTMADGVDNGCIGAWAVHGCANISSPWDTNGSLPAFTTNDTVDAQPSAPVFSTSQANDLIIASGEAGCTDATNDVVTSWTASYTAISEGAGVLTNRLSGFNSGVTSTQSSASAPFASSSSTVNIRYTDALTADASGGGGARRHTLALLGVA